MPGNHFLPDFAQKDAPCTFFHWLPVTSFEPNALGSNAFFSAARVALTESGAATWAEEDAARTLNNIITSTTQRSGVKIFTHK